MSQTELHYGKMQKIARMPETTLEEWREATCGLKGIYDLPMYANSWKDVIQCSYSEDYIIVGDDVYHIIEHGELDEVDYCRSLIINEDRTISLVPYTHRYVETVPDELEEGVVYISEVYGTSIHKCLCGCGTETVMPLNDNRGWQLVKEADDYPEWTLNIAEHQVGYNLDGKLVAYDFGSSI